MSSPASTYDDIEDAIHASREVMIEPTVILIGWDRWMQLRADPRSFGTLVLIDDTFRFCGVQIDPFFEDYPRFEWELVF